MKGRHPHGHTGHHGLARAVHGWRERIDGGLDGFRPLQAEVGSSTRGNFAVMPCRAVLAGVPPRLARDTFGVGLQALVDGLLPVTSEQP